MEAVDSSAHALGQILARLKIHAIVCVDDSYAVLGSPESIIGLISAAVIAGDTGKLLRVSEILGGVLFDTPDEVWTSDVRGWWERASRDERRSVGLRIGEVLDTVAPDDRSAMQRLAALMPQGSGMAVLSELTPEQWREQGDQKIAAATEEMRLLCLFDQNLSGAGLGPDGGIELLRDAVTRLGPNSQGRAYFGLLSHTFGIGEEEPKWRDLTDQHPELSGQFLPIAKARIEDPLQFAHGVKLAVINQNHQRLKDAVAKISQQAFDEAMKRVRELSIWDFDHIVLQSSQREGVWEVETLFRAYGIFERQKRRLHALEEFASFEALTSSLRLVGDVKTHPGLAPSAQVRALRRAELYEDQYINKFSLPIELGDLFAKGHARYMLVAQPCDLVIRGDTGKRRLVTATLVPIVRHDVRQNRTDIYPECDHFTEEEDEHFWHFNFRESTEVSLDVLDLAVFRRDGNCRINLTGPEPDNLFAPWRLRYSILMTRFSELEGPIKDTLAALQSAKITGQRKNRIVAQLLSGFAMKPDVLRPSYRNRDFSFGLQRVGRYLSPGAAEVLTRYEAFRARPAFEHDFAKVLAEEGSVATDQGTSAANEGS